MNKFKLHSIVVLMCSCSTYSYFTGYDSKLVLVNKMHKSFYAGYSHSFPDSSIILYKDTEAYPEHYIWQSEEDSAQFVLKLGTWESFFFHKDSTYKLILFIFDSDTIEKYPWEVVRKEYKIRSRYMFTKKQLDSLNWRIHIY